MRLRIIYQNRGFLTIEIMLAFSLFTLFIISNFTLISSLQRLKMWSLVELEKLRGSVRIVDGVIKNNFTNLFNIQKKIYGNDTTIINIDPFDIYHSDYSNAIGRNNCNQKLYFDGLNYNYFDQGIDIGMGNVSTDIEVRNGIVYLSSDSNTSSKSDFYIIDSRDLSRPYIISSINTGPGVSALEIAGPYAFLAQMSSVNQLQIIDIHDRQKPILISQLKLPLPTSTSTAPFASAIFYSNGIIYLGTTKWNGPEFYIIDVSDVKAPIVLGSFETGTLINDIYINKNIAYLATSDSLQMRVLNITNKINPILINSFSPSGWQTQEGKIVEYFENNLFLGRTVGGFNLISNHELFSFKSPLDFLDSISKDIPGGIYGIIARSDQIFLMTHSISHEFQIFNINLNKKILDMSLGSQPFKMVCDGSNIFFATGNYKGISSLKI